MYQLPSDDMHHACVPVPVISCMYGRLDSQSSLYYICVCSCAEVIVLILLAEVAGLPLYDHI
jgi:hypothetical protein